MTLDVAPLAPVGAVVRGFRIGAADELVVDALRTLLAAHGVLIMPGQWPDDTEFAYFLRLFGDLVFTMGETPVPGHPKLNVVTNVGRDTPPKSAFHADTTYVRRPPCYTALRAVTVPSRGGDTLFTNQYAAYDALPEALRADLRRRTITHVVTGLELGDAAEKSAEHPVAVTHPVSGRTALYLSTPERCAAVSGLSRADGDQLVAALVAHCTRARNVLRHRWSPGDVVMWDNRVVMHKADHDGVVGQRVLHRGMVADARTGPRDR
ncbi:TauD/TfdA dioxygenase family protein [Mycobacterium parmense]|uniref:Taurine catabolism dioxygenase n=1 Tax=Mycobacterium parmense TaxID=185642 RepID=A0A7I7YUZ0_9MYCO|nr:TauD/TfdA family dioxygenase [Mycobacterium parmense]MCV7351720.1 TauD/TfdA family dioxygenase [Mycobacterium parmense]ORW60179.1 taurine catabolism dioxygenase [Mycobacterium parmense]BBZ44813.1 taurine catabolism dioxygenase [Mycobacterium parmense]